MLGPAMPAMLHVCGPVAVASLTRRQRATTRDHFALSALDPATYQHTHLASPHPHLGVSRGRANARAVRPTREDGTSPALPTLPVACLMILIPERRCGIRVRARRRPQPSGPRPPWAEASRLAVLGDRSARGTIEKPVFLNTPPISKGHLTTPRGSKVIASDVPPTWPPIGHVVGTVWCDAKKSRGQCSATVAQG